MDKLLCFYRAICSFSRPLSVRETTGNNLNIINKYRQPKRRFCTTINIAEKPPRLRWMTCFDVYRSAGMHRCRTMSNDVWPIDRIASLIAPLYPLNCQSNNTHKWFSIVGVAYGAMAKCPFYQSPR